MTDLGHDVATLLNRCIDLECQRDCVMVERDALQREVERLNGELWQRDRLLAQAHRTLDDCRVLLRELEPSPLTAVGAAKETHNAAR